MFDPCGILSNLVTLAKTGPKSEFRSNWAKKTTVNRSGMQQFRAENGFHEFSRLRRNFSRPGLGRSAKTMSAWNACLLACVLWLGRAMLFELLVRETAA